MGSPKKILVVCFAYVLMIAGFFVGLSPSRAAYGDRIDPVRLFSMLMNAESVYSIYVSSPLAGVVVKTPTDNYVAPSIPLPIIAYVDGDGTELIRFAANLYGDPTAFPEEGFEWFGSAYSEPTVGTPFHSNLDLASFSTGVDWTYTEVAVYALVNATVVNTETATLTYEAANDASSYLSVSLLETDPYVDPDKNGIPDAPFSEIAPGQQWFSDQLVNGDIRTVVLANLDASNSLYGAIVASPTANISVETPDLAWFQAAGAIPYGESGLLLVQVANSLYAAIDQVYGGGDVGAWASDVVGQQPGTLVTGSQYVSISLVYSIYSEVYGGAVFGGLQTLPPGLCVNLTVSGLQNASGIYSYPAQVAESGTLALTSSPVGASWTDTQATYAEGTLRLCTYDLGIFAPLLVEPAPDNFISGAVPRELVRNVATAVSIYGKFLTDVPLNAAEAAAAYSIYVGASPVAFNEIDGVAITAYDGVLNAINITVPGIDAPGYYDVTVADNTRPSNTVTAPGLLEVLPTTYTVSTTASPLEGGSTSGDGTYIENETVYVTGSPNDRYTFANWSDGENIVSASEIYTFPATVNVALTANFDRITYAVNTSASPSEGGSTSGGGTVNSGDEVTVIGTPNEDYSFASWTEGDTIVSAAAIYTFPVRANVDLVANFDRITYSVSTNASPNEGGSTSGGGTVNSGDEATVVGTPNEDYTFASWTEGGNLVSASAIYTFTVKSNAELVANFDRITYSVTTGASPSEGGSTSGGGTVNSGDEATVVATPTTNYAFINWTEGGVEQSTSPTYTFTARGNRDLVANFQIITYAISTAVSPAASGSASGAGTYNIGDSVTVSATANLGYRFNNWTDGATVVSTSASYTFTAADNRNLVANFVTTPTYTITTSGSPVAGGGTSGGGTFNSGSNVTVVATPTADYAFTNWKQGTTVVSTSASYTFAATANRTLVATFTRLTYPITTAASPSAGGSTTGGGTLNSGASATVRATANTGYTFVNWTEGEDVVSTAANYTFVVDGARNLTANFVVSTYTIAATASPAAGGSISGTGVYTHGDEVTLVATPTIDYTFTNWKQGTTVVSTDPSYTFTATANRTLVATFTIITYSVSTSSAPSAGGTTTGGGTKNSGTTVTAKATPSTGYTFTNWTEDGDIVSTAASYVFIARANRTLVANFARITYTVTTAPLPAEGGSTSGDDTVNSGESVTLVATPAVGYTFSKWTNSGSTTSLSTSASYTFIPTANRSLVANFTRITYVIAATAAPTAGGTVSGAGTKNSGDSVILVATPNTNYAFTNWTEGGVEVDTNPSLTFTASANRTLVANFTLITYTINTAASPPAGGTITGSGVKNSGTSVTVKATPSTGYTFTNWTENDVEVSTAASYVFTASANRDLVANFTRITYTVSTSVLPGEGGSASGDDTVNSGESVTLVATSAPNYRFVKWTNVGSTTSLSTSATYTFTPTANRSLVANFALITYTIAATATPTAGGTVSGAGTKNSGDSVTLVATPNANYAFTNWTEGGVEAGTTPSLTFTASMNRTLVANFALIKYTINTVASPPTGGTLTGGGIKNSGTSVTVKATPSTGYTFTNWTEDGQEVSATASYVFTASANRDLVANFARITYSVSTSVLPAEGGSASGDGTVNSGDQITVVATPAPNYRFVKWTNAGSTTSLSTAASYAFTPTANRTLVANFALITYTIAATAAPTAGGTVSGAGVKNSGDSVTLVATPNANYSFTNWTEGGIEVSTTPSLTFTASANRTLVANFTLITYTISTSSSPTAGGTTTGGGTKNSGSSVTVKATPTAAVPLLNITGYTFLNWTEGGVVVSTTASYTFVAAGNRSLVANFIPINTVSSLTMQTPVTGGQSSAGTVTITPAAPAGGRTVTLTSTNAAVLSVPATVLVPAGQTSVAFSATSSAVTTGTNVTVKAAIGTSNKSLVVRVNP